QIDCNTTCSVEQWKHIPLETTLECGKKGASEISFSLYGQTCCAFDAGCLRYIVCSTCKKWAAEIQQKA
ncbi:Protein of unknown function, partial [Gryllus bimaculatus]